MATSPLNPRQPIVQADGTPSPFFMRWIQDQGITNSGIPVFDTAASISVVLDLIGDSHGALLFRGASLWETLSPGSSGSVLTTQGASANPVWTANTFIGLLSDTPASYVGETQKIPWVNAGETALEFQAISDILDAEFSNTQGSILYRNASGWVALGPGAASEVLTSGGAGANPSWAAASGGASDFVSLTDTPGSYNTFQNVLMINDAVDGLEFRVPGNLSGYQLTSWVTEGVGLPFNTTYSSSAFALKGNNFTCNEDCIVRAVSTRVSATGDYKLVVCELDTFGPSATITKVLYEGAFQTIGAGTISYLFTGTEGEAPKLEAGKEYGIYTIVSGTTTTPNRCVFPAGSATYSGTELTARDSVREAIQTPAPGQSVYHEAISTSHIKMDIELWKGHGARTVNRAMEDEIDNTHGAILYHNGSEWVSLPPGTTDQVLKTKGASANPAWEDESGGGGGGGAGTSGPVKSAEWELVEARSLSGASEIFNLDSEDEVLLVLDDVSFAVADFPIIRASTDGGSTYKSGSSDYHETLTGNTPILNRTVSGVTTAAGTVTTPHNSVVMVSGAQVDGAPTVFHPVNVGSGTTTAAIRTTYTKFNEVVTHLEFKGFGGQTLNGGTIYVYKRKTVFAGVAEETFTVEQLSGTAATLDIPMDGADEILISGRITCSVSDRPRWRLYDGGGELSGSVYDLSFLSSGSGSQSPQNIVAWGNTASTNYHGGVLRVAGVRQGEWKTYVSQTATNGASSSQRSGSIRDTGEYTGIRFAPITGSGNLTYELTVTRIKHRMAVPAMEMPAVITANFTAGETEMNGNWVGEINPSAGDITVTLDGTADGLEPFTVINIDTTNDVLFATSNGATIIGPGTTLGPGRAATIIRSANTTTRYLVEGALT